MEVTWLRRNPGRASLLIIAVLMALLIAVLAATTDETPAPNDTPTVAPATPGEKTPTTGVPQSSQSVPVAPPVAASTATPDPHGEHRQPDARPVQKTTVRYLSTFLDHQLTLKIWRSRLNALSTTSHQETLATVPQSAVPATSVHSVAVTRLASGAAVATATLRDGTVLLVALVLDADGWKVSRVVPQTARR